ncbi:MAG: RHS repeat-associated core domain-containing protein, partial [Bacteroidia bacterium]
MKLRYVRSVFLRVVNGAAGSKRCASARALFRYRFFDKYFNLDPTRSEIRKANNPDQLAMLSAEEISFNTTGYFYVYVTNESPTDVSFDNLLIKHYPGFLLQENHYYPFGLLNKALSSDEQKGFHQRYGFNGKEFENGLDWRVNDFGARMYDPVVGRWGSVDPKAHLMPGWSPYSAMFCNPILNIDPDGAFPYTIHVRSFHPQASFGGGFMGDNRGFSNNPSASSRIGQHFTFDPSKGLLTNKGFDNNFSFHPGMFIQTNGLFGLGKETPKATGYDVKGGNG